MPANNIYGCLQERLFANSVPEHTGYRIDGEPSECWLWVGSLDKNGYPRMSMRLDGKHQKVRVYRISYPFFTGGVLLPDETWDHACRIHHCIHPNHGEPCARAENTRRSQRDNYRAPPVPKPKSLVWSTSVPGLRRTRSTGP